MRTTLCPWSVGLSAALGMAALACSTDPPASSGNSGAGGMLIGASGSGGASAQPGAGTTSTQGGSSTTQGGTTTMPGGGQVGGGGTNVGTAGTNASGGSAPVGEVIGAAQFGAGDLDAATDGGTLTFQNIGAVGYYPSSRAKGSATCDAWQSDQCCMVKHQLTDDKLTPWNEDLIVTLRGPMQIKQFVVYQPTAGSDAEWSVTSAWDQSAVAKAFGIAFNGKATAKADFAGTIGSTCLADAMTDKPSGCSATSTPICSDNASLPKNLGWSGSKLFVIAARMPGAAGGKIDAATACKQGTTDNWYDAPWIGISVGELVREDKFGACNCYGKTPETADGGGGCGQFNAFEVVNDNGDYQNFSVFSSNFFGYQGYIGEGPCGKNACQSVGATDLVDKATSKQAAKGGVTVAGAGAGMPAAHVAFARPQNGYRYFVVLFDVTSRQVQMAVIHPSKLPAAVSGILPRLPRSIGRATIDSLLALRLPG